MSKLWSFLKSNKRSHWLIKWINQRGYFYQNTTNFKFKAYTNFPIKLGWWLPLKKSIKDQSPLTSNKQKSRYVWFLSRWGIVSHLCFYVRNFKATAHTPTMDPHTSHILLKHFWNTQDKLSGSANTCIASLSQVCLVINVCKINIEGEEAKKLASVSTIWLGLLLAGH